MRTANRAPRVLVLGGGISGLVTAWHLHRRGAEVTVWEASVAVGGWAQTLPWPGPHGEAGFRERGPQALRIARGGALERLLDELSLDRQAPGPRGPRWLGTRGRRHPSPATLAGLVRAPGLTLAERLRMLREPFAPPPPPQEEDLRAFFVRRLGEGFAREWLPALVAGLLAAPPDQIGADTLPELRRLEASGGLLLGGLRRPPAPTRVPAGGVGALARTLADRLGSVVLDRPACALEPLPEGRWRVRTAREHQDADAVVLALPSGPASGLLRPVAREAAGILEAIPRLDLRVWHSRHLPVPGWERGFGLLVHPPEGRGLLGAVSFPAEDPRGVPGLMQLRTYLGGAYPVDPALEAWPGVLAELRRWLPELGDAVQVIEDSCPGAFPRLGPGHPARSARVEAALPAGLHWVGADRFGPGLADLAEGLEAWTRTAAI